VATVNFLCAKCEWRLTRSAGEPESPCENCETPNGVLAPPVGAIIERCAACGHEEMYAQKDFNRVTGIAIIAVGAVLVPWTHYLSLLAVTILDYIIWRKVKEVEVCYDCQAVHRGYPVNPVHKPFDLVTHDRHVYGQAPPGAEEKRIEN
jgi:hypothetical protein